MVKKCNFLFFLIALISCKGRNNINLNPIEPNYGIKLYEIIEDGYELETASCGFCSYQKIVDNKKIYFLLDFEDDCRQVKIQQVLIPIDTAKIQSEEDKLGIIRGIKVIDFHSDSLRIENIISNIGGLKISNTKKRLGSSNSISFDVKNKNTGKIYEALLSYWPDNVLYLSFEIPLIE